MPCCAGSAGTSCASPPTTVVGVTDHLHQLEVLLDDLLWAMDHTDDRTGRARAQAQAIILLARAHNRDWHNARAFRRATLGERYTSEG